MKITPYGVGAFDGYLFYLPLRAATSEEIDRLAPQFCDQLAGDPLDPRRAAPGVEFPDINAVGAIAQCRKAIEQYPNEPRFKHQLAAGLLAGGKVDEAYSMFASAARDGYPVSQLAMGNLGLAGLKADGKRPDAEYWLNEAAKQGFPRAQAILGEAYAMGRFGPHDRKLGLLWMERAEATGDLYARATYWAYLLIEAARKPDTAAAELACKRLVETANAGGIEAMKYLGEAFAGGTGVSRNLSTSVDWYEMAAERGDSYAQRRLALAYENGSGREKTPEKALYWYRQSAARGDVMSTLTLRKMNGSSQKEH